MQVKRKSLKKIAYPAVSLATFIAVWFIVAKILNVEVLIPTPTAVLGSLINLVSSGNFYLAVLGTLGRTVVGYLISMVIALCFTAIALLSKGAERAISPLVLIARATPTMSIILLALVWLNANLSPILVGVLITFPALYSALLGGIRSVDEGLLQMSKVYNVPLKKRIRYLYVPSVVPSFAEQSASCASLNVKVVIAGEVLAQTSGSIGIEMQLSRIFIETPTLLAWTCVAILLSFCFEVLIKRLFKLLPGGRA